MTDVVKIFSNNVKLVRNIRNRPWFLSRNINNNSKDTILNNFNILVQKDGCLEEHLNVLYYVGNGHLSVKLCGYEVCKEEEKNM